MRCVRSIVAARIGRARRERLLRVVANGVVADDVRRRGHVLGGLEGILVRQLLANRFPWRAVIELGPRGASHLDARVRIDDEHLVRLLDRQVLHGIAELVLADGFDRGWRLDDRLAVEARLLRVPARRKCNTWCETDTTSS